MKPNYSTVSIPTARDYLSLDLPPIHFLVGDWLPRGSSLLVGGAPKVGKSWFVYHLADAIARGVGFLNWQCAQGSAVIIDCDNRPQTIQKRLALMANSYDGGAPDALRIITRETFTDRNLPFPNFRDSAQLVAVFDLIGKCDVVFLDNVNLAFPGGNENDTTFWNDSEAFVLEARKRGMTCVVVHHTKKGDPYEFSGSYKQCRIFEGGIVLGKIGSEAGKAAYFNVVFKFMRDTSDQTEQFSAKLTSEDNLLTWEVGPYMEPLFAVDDEPVGKKREVQQLRLKGFSVDMIADATGIPRSTVGRWVRGVSPISHIPYETSETPET